MKNEPLNTFIEPIIKKKYKYDFFAWIAKNKLMRKIKKTSPSFADMIEIHEFLNILRNSYMYDNNSDFHLFLGSVGKSYSSRNTLAMIYKEHGFGIKFVLVISDKNQINIEITRNGQSKNDIEKISFYDGEYQFKDIYDQEKMLFIVSCLMNGVAELVDYYYKNKKL